MKILADFQVCFSVPLKLFIDTRIRKIFINPNDERTYKKIIASWFQKYNLDDELFQKHATGATRN